MKKVKNIILGLIIVGLFVICYFYLDKNKGIRVTKWDNFYTGENIEIFYEPIRSGLVLNPKLEKIKTTYKVNEIVENENDEKKKILKCCEILSNIITPDDISNSGYFNAYDILKSKENNKKVSKKDGGIILRDLILSSGYESRVGVFRKENSQFEKKSNYYVVEYWSEENNKWVMVDFLRKAIPTLKEESLGAIDLINNDNLRKVKFIDKDGEEVNGGLRKIKDYLSSYSISIDNTLDRKKSNTDITYSPSIENVDLLSSEGFLSPTIYLKEKNLFDSSQYNKKNGEDKTPYIILMKEYKNKKAKEEKTEEEIEKDKFGFLIGSFKDGKTIENYYLNINDEGFKKVKAFKEYTLVEGENKIELSLDGKNTLKSIEIVRDKLD